MESAPKQNEDRIAAAALNFLLAPETRLPNEIKIGDRHRKDQGDLTSLVRSINKCGLMHPIVITPSNQLIAGGRRLVAWQHPECEFRNQPIPVTVVNIDSIIAGELDENEVRKDFTPSEAVAIKNALEPKARAEAKERQRQHGGTAPGRKAEQSAKVAHSDQGRAIEKAAKATGRSARTLEKAEAIVKAAETDPDKYGKLVQDMDRTGRVNGPYNRLKNSLAAEAIKKEPPCLPMNGPYRSGIIDIPWASEPNASQSKDHGARGYYPYPTMTPEKAAAMPVPTILHADVSVWLWIPNFHLMHGHHLTIAKAWGLRPVTLLTWIKKGWGQGQRARGATEHVIQMIRGNVPCLGGDTRTWFEGRGDIHSQKPGEFYELVEKLTPAPRYFELFSRGAPRANWDLHGNEVGTIAASSPRSRARVFPPRKAPS